MGQRGLYYREQYLQESFRNSSGRSSTALHYACRIGDWEIVEELLNAGADWLQKNDDEKVPRDFFDEELDFDVLEKYDNLCQELGEAKKRGGKVRTGRTREISRRTTRTRGTRKIGTRRTRRMRETRSRK